MAGISRTECGSPGSEAADCRCLCGNLLARLVAGGVEVKCRRCKRTLLLPLDSGSAYRVAAPSVAAAEPKRRTG